MDNFKVVYRILRQLEKDLDNNKADLDVIDHNALCISENRWCHYIEMMCDAGYIKGVRIVEYNDGSRGIDADDMQITLKGLEYLQENSIMQRMYKTIKGINDVIPGI